MVVKLFNFVIPDTFNGLLIEVILFNVVIPDTFNDDINVVLLFNVVVPDTFKLLVVNVEEFVKLLIYVNNDVDVAFKLSIFNLLYVSRSCRTCIRAETGSEDTLCSLLASLARKLNPRARASAGRCQPKDGSRPPPGVGSAGRLSGVSRAHPVRRRRPPAWARSAIMLNSAKRV